MADFKKGVSEYLAWEVSQILKKESPRSPISERIAKLEEEFKVGGGAWREFRIGDIFKKIKTEKVSISLDLSQNILPATTAGWDNNQLTRLVSPVGATILRNVISVTANGLGKAFYQDYDFTILQDSYAIDLIDDLQVFKSKKVLLFFVCALNKAIVGKFDFSNKSVWRRVSDEIISLPCNISGEIDFSFMEKFIAELESERLEELDRHLSVTGLKDYELNKAEKSALEIFNSQNLEFEGEGGGKTYSIPKVA